MTTVPPMTAARLFPPGFTLDRGVQICVAELGLTPRESAIALHLALEQGPKQVMAKLGCAEGTVRSHVRAILLKLAVKSSTGIAGIVVATVWRIALEGTTA